MDVKVSRLNGISRLYLLVLLLGYIGTGWLLSDCNANWFTWTGTQVITVHLAWVGFDAVALAVAWIVLLVWVGAFAMTWPQSIPWAGIPPWAFGLAMTWIMALGLILTLAQVKHALLSAGLNKHFAFWFLAIFTSVGLGIGRILAEGLFLN
ncbi:hypothetical protein [Chroococcidiopsis thermalis]|uniref:Uncharacterized protein n=1 Tax=Chroococcidiopsis thermalis (strain PCC 7203) TaxID=251229 RepID=K9U6Z2_CHRTP|nr:hypothetical protein [Chroococcidiopsis thermalis]AFY90605.1 hypothetical protein Chro_5236 [Chroococcidiopsis thermalis PCC 7203]PSB48032.1 hypothetical protein C7B80_07070 [Cyanosarcina cf. burmensis CCALA 770]